MANSVLNPTIIAKTAVRLLENELVMGSLVYRGYEDEFDKKYNGYEVGDTISIRKPAQFTVRTGANVSQQDVTEGKMTLSINQQKGVDFKFSGTELTLKIEELADRVIRPAMIRLANQIDIDLMNLFPFINNWVGQPVTGADDPVSQFSEFARGAERLDQMACPTAERGAVLAPDSYWALAGGSLGQFLPQVNQQNYREGEIGKIGGVATYMSQNVPTYNGGGVADSAATVNGNQSVSYLTVQNAEGMPGIWGPQGGLGTGLVTAGWAGGGVVKAGTVFTIGSAATAVHAVNPVTRAVLPFQQQFTVVADATISTGAATLTITPPIILPTGADAAFATCDIQATTGAALNIVGDASGSYRQNLMFHRNAFALCIVPMVKPPGAVDVARESYKGTSVRLIPYYSGDTDISNFRLDVLYGLKVIDSRLAVRLSGGTGTVGNPSL